MEILVKTDCIETEINIFYSAVKAVTKILLPQRILVTEIYPKSQMGLS